MTELTAERIADALERLADAAERSNSMHLAANQQASDVAEMARRVFGGSGDDDE